MNTNRIFDFRPGTLKVIQKTGKIPLFVHQINRYIGIYIRVINIMSGKVDNG